MKTLYFGGPILTMSDPLYVQAVLVEDGRILAAGSLDRLERMDAGRRVDLKGAALLPGFIDPHSHFSQMAAACLQVSLEGAGSVEEIAQRIGRFLSETSPAPAPGCPPGTMTTTGCPVWQTPLWSSWTPWPPATPW